MLTSIFLLAVFLCLTFKPVFASEEEEEEPEDRELEAIREKLSSEDVDLRSETVDYLSYCGHPKAFDLLVETLKDPDWAVRKDAVIALGSMGDLKAVPHITLLLSDGYWHVRKEVIRIMGLLGGKDAVGPLMNLLRSQDELIKSSAQKALIKVGNKAIEGMLSKKITDRWMAAKTLGALKDKRPLPLLQEAIKIERDVKVKKAIQETIDILSNLSEQQQIQAPPEAQIEESTSYDPDDIIPDEPEVAKPVPAQKDQLPANVAQPLPAQTTQLPENVTQPLPAQTTQLPENVTQPLPAQTTQSTQQAPEQLQVMQKDQVNLITEPGVKKDSALDREVDAFLASLDEE